MTAASVTSAPAKAGGVLVATSLATLVVNANTSAVSILLPSISKDVGTSVDTLQWAVTGYSLVGAAVIVTSGSLGDVYGRKKVFLAGLFLFIGSCVLLALSSSGAAVIAGRMIQGAAGATLLACGLSLLSVANTGQAQLRAVSIWGGASAVGAAAGPLIGGLLVDTTGWQGLFWLDAAIAAVCVFIGLATITESRDPSRPRSIDIAGTLLIAAVLVPLVLGLSEAGDWGWGSPAFLGCMGISVVAGFAFVAVERRVTAPLLDLSLLRNMILVATTVAILICSGAINALMYLLALYFQNPDTLAFTPLQAGVATLPATVGLVVLTPMIPRLAARFGGRKVIALGFILMTLGFGWFGLVDASWKYAAFVLPLVILAVGMGMANGPASSASTAAVSTEQVGAASGISNMARYVGAAVFTALAATISGSVTSGRQEEGASGGDALAAGLSRASIALAITCVLGILLARWARRYRPAGTSGADIGAAAAAHAHTVPIPAAPTTPREPARSGGPD